MTMVANELDRDQMILQENLEFEFRTAANKVLVFAESKGFNYSNVGNLCLHFDGNYKIEEKEAVRQLLEVVPKELLYDLYSVIRKCSSIGTVCLSHELWNPFYLYTLGFGLPESVLTVD